MALHFWGLFGFYFLGSDTIYLTVVTRYWSGTVSRPEIGREDLDINGALFIEGFGMDDWNG